MFPHKKQSSEESPVKRFLIFCYLKSAFPYLSNDCSIFFPEEMYIATLEISSVSSADIPSSFILNKKTVRIL